MTEHYARTCSIYSDAASRLRQELSSIRHFEWLMGHSVDNAAEILRLRRVAEFCQRRITIRQLMGL